MRRPSRGAAAGGEARVRHGASRQGAGWRAARRRRPMTPVAAVRKDVAGRVGAASGRVASGAVLVAGRMAGVGGIGATYELRGWRGGGGGAAAAGEAPF